ncbi:MAG: hypothetical protein ABW034_12265 [Steroidobacteraceae bacterium]
MIITPYDEFPVHQAARPFSYIPSTDYNWDDGYWFAFMNAKEKMFVGCGARVNPNTDMIGGYALVNIAGIQRTVRFSRCWRRDFSLNVGPFKMEFVEPLKKIRLVLEENASEIGFDVVWDAVAPPVLEGENIAFNRGRRTTEQSRYCQSGKASGWLRVGAQRWSVDHKEWNALRDRSWGLYTERPPFGPDPKLLPPKESGTPRAFRFWSVFTAEPFSGTLQVHEAADGTQGKLDDVFGTPPEGVLQQGYGDLSARIKTIEHDIEFYPDSRILRRAALKVGDAEGREWTLDYAFRTPPWMIVTMGYTPGSWKDGGTFHSYHGSEELALEWDEFDFSRQPVVYKPYNLDPRVNGGFNANLDFTKPITGIEYLGEVTVTSPSGQTGRGAGQVEFILSDKHHRYGREA